MPILGGFITVFFAKVFEYLSTRFALGVAFGLAGIATSLAAVAALKLALSAVWAGVSLVAPQIVLDAFTLVMPSNFGSFITGIILVDVISAAYGYWRQTERTAYLAKNYIT